jgi:hypothetical protein
MKVSVRRHRAAMTVLSMAVLTLLLPVSLSATTAQVFPVGGTKCVSGVSTTFNSISAAVAGVVSGSTIYICPGTYAEQVVITKKLTLTGVGGNGLSGASASGQNNPVLVPPPTGLVANATDLADGSQIAAQIAVQTPAGSVGTPINVKISNLVVDGSNNVSGGCAPDPVGIYYQNASGSLLHLVTRFQEPGGALNGCQSGLGIYVVSGYGSGGSSAMIIEDNSVHDYNKNGITVDGSATVATIEDNYIVGAGATPLNAQNGIQISDGARGTISSNIVSDDVYVNAANCYVDDIPCYSATGILLYASGGSSANPVALSNNTIGNTQGAIVAVPSATANADYNNLSTNKVTTTPAIAVTGYTYLLDAIDLCSNNNTAVSNTVMNSAGAGVHLDSSCTEGGLPTGSSSSATTNTVNEACAGVLLGSSGATQSGTVTYNVVETTYSGDSCPTGLGASAKIAGRLKPQPKHN